MARLRVLYISNSHPDFYVGGVEVFTYELYRGMRVGDDFEPILLARSTSSAHQFRPGKVFHAVDEDPHQVLWQQPNHDYFSMTCPDKEQYTVHFHEFLTAYRPQIVHIQHTLGLGVDLIRQIKTSLPATPIVYTLHEFLPICSAHGQMLRTEAAKSMLCDRASPARCHQCFPERRPVEFFLRERYIKAQFRLVDLFLAPSRFLVRRYVEWGIPADRIRFLENGRIVPPDDVTTICEEPPLGHFGFFGQIGASKGILVLLQAMKKLRQEAAGDVHLYLNGANLEQEPETVRQQVAALMGQCDNVTFLGKYEISELPERMSRVSWVVVPSIWWENSPMIIQEAFMYKRPVICSNIGGMAEKVEHGVNGLHFQVSNVDDLARSMLRAASSPDLRRRLSEGIQPVYTMGAAIEAHRSIYRQLLSPGAS